MEEPSEEFRTREEICARLDAIVVEFFEQLSSLDAKKAVLEKTMADGFIQLSKTRYNMGSNRTTIGAAMYDGSNMNATVNVAEIVERGKISLQLIPSGRPKVPETEAASPAPNLTESFRKNDLLDGLRKRKGVAEGKIADIADDDDSSKPSTLLEKRDDDTLENLGKAVGDLKVSPIDGMMELQDMVPQTSGASPKMGQKSSPNKSVNNDPIRWFGILVPQSLKISQQNFKTSLDLVVEIANMQLEIDGLQSQFKKLMQLKNSIHEKFATDVAETEE